jgi:hypothetical protein
VPLPLGEEVQPWRWSAINLALGPLNADAPAADECDQLE